VKTGHDNCKRKDEASCDLEEGGIDSAKTESIENQSSDVYENDREQFFGDLKFKCGNFDFPSRDES